MGVQLVRPFLSLSLSLSVYLCLHLGIGHEFLLFFVCVFLWVNQEGRVLYYYGSFYGFIAILIG